MAAEKASGHRHRYVSTTPTMHGRIAVTVVTTIVLLLVHCNSFTTAPTSRRVSVSKPGVPGHYPYTKPSQQPWNPPFPKDQSGDEPIQRLIVKVRLENEDDSWIDLLPSSWRKEVIMMDRDASNMYEGGKSVDKGRIADAYLRWIIENYRNLPKTLVFLHPQSKQLRQSHAAINLDGSPGSGSWNIDIHNLQIPFIQSAGFANLQCPSSSRCANPFRLPSHHFRTLDLSMARTWESIFGAAPLPDKLAAPLTADLAVSRAQVQKRSTEEYLKFWTWLNKTAMDDETAGRVIESIWHVIFGQDATFCHEERKCQCDVYGKCE